MIVRYTRRAQGDLAKILNYLDERSPCGALSVRLAIKRTIDTRAVSLSRFLGG
jgi:plasmid stabilization system protein ParE